MTTKEKCEAVLRKILAIANEKERFTLERDFGNYTATIYCGMAHTHIGFPGEDGSWEQFVDDLYNILHNGPGLSWVDC